jgi:hypothetical protein
MIKHLLRMFVISLCFIVPFKSMGGLSGIGVRTTYSSANVGTSTWVVLVSTLPNTVSQIAVADTSGQTMEIGICNANASANSEMRQFLIPPGGITVKIQIPVGQRISIRAVSSTAISGENDLNVLF